MVAVIAPILAGIIEQGRKENLFSVTHPMAAAEIILQLSSANRGAMAELATPTRKSTSATARAALEEGLRFQGVVVDRMLGLRDGSVDLVGSPMRKRASS